MIYTEILEDDYKEDVWYPDDSGLWIETYGQDFTKNLLPNQRIQFITNDERIKKDTRYYNKLYYPAELNSRGLCTIVAIKIFY